MVVGQRAVEVEPEVEDAALVGHQAIAVEVRSGDGDHLYRADGARPFRPAPRALPRWSVVTPVPEHTPAGTPPTAGLVDAGSSVLVGPPLAPSAPTSPAGR